MTSITPNSSIAGSTAVIKGKSFGGNQGSGGVTFNVESAEARAWSHTSITATVTSDLNYGDYPVMVTAIAGTSNNLTFTVKSRNVERYYLRRHGKPIHQRPAVAAGIGDHNAPGTYSSV